MSTTIFVACITVVDLNNSYEDNSGVSSQAMFSSGQTAHNWLMREMNQLHTGHWTPVEDRYEWHDAEKELTYEAYIYEDTIYDSLEEEEQAVREHMADFEKRFGLFVRLSEGERASPSVITN